jgi:isoleucyl-tRNA synthetase
MSIDFPKEEEHTIERWREIGAFERQVGKQLQDPCVETAL